MLPAGEEGWNLWHGCRPVSAGCAHCYVYRGDARYGRNAAEVKRTELFDLPVRKNRDGSYKIPSGTTIWTCFTSDFFLEDADAWRPMAWEMMRERQDLQFNMITKRIHRAAQCLPSDWGNGWENVAIWCTCENSERAAFRMPYYLDFPCRHKEIICEPCLEYVDFKPWLPAIGSLTVGGESGNEARVCDWAWVERMYRDCEQCGAQFHFHQTGSFLRKDGKIYQVPRAMMHAQARKAEAALKGAR